MLKLFSFFIIASLFLVPLFQVPSALGSSCDIATAAVPKTSFLGEDIKIQVKFPQMRSLKSGTYRLLITNGAVINPLGGYQDLNIDAGAFYAAGQDTIEFTVPGSNFNETGNYTVKLQTDITLTGFQALTDICSNLGTISVFDKKFAAVGDKCSINLSDNNKLGETIQGSVFIPDNSDIDFNFEIYKGHVSVNLPKIPQPALTGTDPNPVRSYGTKGATRSITKNQTLVAGENTLQIADLRDLELGKYTAVIRAGTRSSQVLRFYCHIKEFEISRDETSEPKTPGKTLVAPGAAAVAEAISFSAAKKHCNPDSKDCSIYEPQKCPDGSPGIMTAIGCVPTEPKALVEGLIKFATLAGGGIAFLIMILAALQMITAEGNPESIKGAQEKFYSAIIGLLFIIFSVLLMQVIGVDILGLKGFGK